MGIKQLYNDNLRKLPNEYGDVSVMVFKIFFYHAGLRKTNQIGLLHRQMSTLLEKMKTWDFYLCCNYIW